MAAFLLVERATPPAAAPGRAAFGARCTRTCGRGDVRLSAFQFVVTLYVQNSLAVSAEHALAFLPRLLVALSATKMDAVLVGSTPSADPVRLSHSFLVTAGSCAGLDVLRNFMLPTMLYSASASH